MGFEGLLGNDRLKDILTGSLKKGRVSHFYLICGPDGAGKHTLARLLAAAILCQGTGKPCGVCPACRKVMGGAHPDFITVDDPEKKTVPVDLIRQARADIYVQPNESDHKIYLFPRGQDMGLPGQNALLKVLEEPPAYGVFILLTDNPEKLLPTVRSRCTELKLLPLPGPLLRGTLSAEFPQADGQTIDAAMSRSGGYLGQARKILQDGEAVSQQTRDFAACFAQKDNFRLLQVLVPMEKLKRDQLIDILNEWLELLQNALVCRSGMAASSKDARNIAAGRDSKDLLRCIRHLQKCVEYAQGNVSPAAVCGFLEWALR